MTKIKLNLVNYQIILFSHLIGGLIVLGVFLLQSELLTTIVFFKYVSLCILLWNVSSLYFLKKSIKNPSFLFYSTFFIFLLSRVLIDVLGGHNFADTIFFSNYRFSNLVQYRLLSNLIIAIWAWHLGCLLALRFDVKQFVYSTSHSIEMRGRYFFFVGLPFAFYAYYQQALDVFQHGYMIRFTGHELYHKSFITILLEEIYLLGFYMILASKLDLKKTRPFIIIYIIGLAIELGSGARGPVMVRVLVLIWFLTYSYNFKMNVQRLFLLTFMLVSISVYVYSYRLGIKLDFELFLDMVSKFFYTMGISLQVPGYAIEHIEKLSDFSLLDLFARTKDYFNVIVSSVHLDLLKLNIDSIPMHERINYAVNPLKANQGMGMGGSYVAEFFLLGYEWAQLFLGILFGFLFNRIFQLLQTSSRGVIIVLLILPSLIYTPRHSIFFFIQAGFVSFVIIFIMYVMNKLNNSHNSNN